MRLPWLLYVVSVFVVLFELNCLSVVCYCLMVVDCCIDRCVWCVVCCLVFVLGWLLVIV